ncbi:MAG: trans-aconitate 2-methyltransferase [bacterium]
MDPGQLVKRSFDKAAEKYDQDRRKLIPCFDEFYAAILELIPFPPDASPRVLDLGAGTGILSAFLAEAFPQARITAADFSEKMLYQARRRFAAQPDRVELLLLDYAKEDLPGNFDAIVSAMSIHHLTEPEKRALYGKIFGALRTGGIFINADQVLGPTPEIERQYHAVWLRQTRAKGIDETSLAECLERMKEDKQNPLLDQLAWLRETGFQPVDCAYKNFRFAVFWGRK